MASPPPILIIGAGLGGLALAHGLHKANRPFTIYERDPSASFRAQGYRIRISAQGAEALHACVSPAQWAVFEQRCAHPPTAGFAGLDAFSAAAQESDHKPLLQRPDAAKFAAYTADRIVTRDLLLQGLPAGSVAFGKELASVAERADGVTAQFTDGTAATGALLVGADGLRSVVRRAGGFPPHVQPVDTEGRALFGKTPLTPAVEAQIPDVLRRGTTCLVQDRSRAKVLSLFVESVRFPHGNGATHPDDYLYWVLLANRGVFAADVPRLSHEDAAAESRRAIERWAPSLRIILDQQDIQQTAGLRICSSVPSKLQWASHGCVTALGDAIHVMPPAGGQGANTALRDAAALVEALGREATVGESVKEYEAAMRAYAVPAVEMSLRGGQWMFDQPPYDECEVAAF